MDIKGGANGTTTKEMDPESAPDKIRERRRSETSIVSRGKWGSKWEFLLSCIGLSVGIGNVWRFPYLAYQNGGGAFLIPYLIMLVLVGKPIYFLELAFGQFAGVGPLAIWSCVPMAKGIGFAMVTVCIIICIYYNVIMSYCIYFLASSFQSVLPWTTCDQDWIEPGSCIERNANRTRDENGTLIKSNATYASSLYFNKYVLDQSSGISEIGGVKWDLALCLLLSWIIVVICLVKGIKTSGKVVYFASTFPYVVLITLMITGLLQPGAIDGVLYFITPQWEKLLDIQVWRAAAGQMFFSLGVSMGALIMYSSYNDFKNNVFRDAMIVSVMDTLTSIIAGLVIFSVIGAMANEIGVSVSEVVQGGPGLAFIAYPDALARLPVPQLFSVLFFIMLFVLGLNSEFALLENVLTSISDEITFLRNHKLKFCIGTSLVFYLIGLIFVTRGGLHVLDVVDNYGGTLSVTFIAVAETIAICWVYGINNLKNDINFMLNKQVGWYWTITWVVTSPIILSIILVYSLATHESLSTKGEPGWVDAFAWIMTFVSVLQIPLWAVIMTFMQPGPSFKEKIQQALRPTADWGPASPEYKAYWLALKGKSPTSITNSSSTAVLTINAVNRMPMTIMSSDVNKNEKYTLHSDPDRPPSYTEIKVESNGVNNPAFQE